MGSSSLRRARSSSARARISGLPSNSASKAVALSHSMYSTNSPLAVSGSPSRQVSLLCSRSAGCVRSSSQSERVSHSPLAAL